jgi:hypothetical protein
MSGVVRNAPCPCGSGKKYKQCCLRADEERDALHRRRYRGAELALDWVMERHEKPYEKAVLDGFFAALSEAERDVIAHLDGETRGLIDTNIGEWLLADGELELGEEGATETRRIMDLVLAADGPTLDPDQRALLEQLRDRPLRLYEVVASAPGAALTLRDALEPASTVALTEPGLAAMFEPGEYLGARLIEHAGAWETSGSLYGFGPVGGEDVLARLRDELATFAPESTGDEAWLRRQVVSDTIIDEWLAGMVGPETDEGAE